MRSILGLLVVLGYWLTIRVGPGSRQSSTLGHVLCAEVKPPQQADSARKVVVIVIPVSANFNAEERHGRKPPLRDPVPEVGHGPRPLPQDANRNRCRGA